MSSLFSFSDQNYVSKNVNDKLGLTDVTVVEETFDGGLLIGGNIINYGGVIGRNYLIKVTQDGIIDEQFVSNASDGAKFSDKITCIKQLSDGTILVGGNFTNYNGVIGRSFLIKLNSDGTLNTAFTDNVTTDSTIGNFKFDGQIYSLDVQSDGKIAVGGSFTDYDGRYNRSHFIVLNSDGTTDESFNFAVDGPFLKYSGSYATISLTSGSSIATTTLSYANFNIGCGIENVFGGTGIPSGTFIEDIYTISTTKYIKLSKNATASGTRTVYVNRSLYNFKGSTTSGSNVISTDDYRFFNAVCKTIAGNYEIYFQMETGEDPSFASRYSSGKIVYSSAFSNGTSITNYDGIVTIDGINYHKFGTDTFSSPASTSTISNCLVGLKSITVRVFVASSTNVYIRDDFATLGGYLRVGRTLFTLNPSATGAFGTGVNAKILSWSYVTAPGFGTGWSVNVDKPTSSINAYTMYFGETSIPLQTKQNEVFNVNANFSSSLLGFIDFQNYVVSTNNFTTSSNANATGNIELTCGTKFSSIVNCIKVLPTDNSIFVGCMGTYNGNYSGLGYLAKLTSSGFLDKTFLSGLNAFIPNTSYTVPRVSSLDFIDNNTNLIVAGNFFNYGGILNNCLIKISTTSGIYNVPFANEVTDNFGNKDIDPVFGDQFWCALTSVSVKYDPISNQEKIYPSGFFQDAGYGGSSGRLYIIRLNSDGSVDTNFCTTLIDNKINYGVAIKTAIGRVVKGNISNSFYIVGILYDDYFKQFNKYSTVLNKS